MGNNLKELLDIKKITANPLYQSYNLVIVPAISVLLCLLIAALITIPQALKITDTNKKITENKAEQAFYKRKIAELQQIDTELYKKNLDTALVALPSDRDIPSAISDILNLLSSSGLQLYGMTFNQTGGAPGLESFQIKLDVVGDLSQLKQFIALSKETTRILKIDSIEITSSTSNSQTQANLNILAFYQAIPPSVTVPIDQKVNLFTEVDQAVVDKIRQNTTYTDFSAATASAVEVGKDDPFN